MFSKVQFWLSLCCLSMILSSMAHAATAELANVLEYGILCKIYRLLESVPDGPHFGGSEKAADLIVDNIIYLSNCTSLKNFQNDSLDSEIQSWVREKGRPGVTSHPRIAAKFNLLKSSAKLARQKLEDLQTKARNAGQRARENLAQALYGETAVAGPQGPVTPTKLALTDGKVFAATTPANACGKGGGSPAATGTTLLNDFFCICVGAGTSLKPCSGAIVSHGSGGSSSNYYHLTGHESIDAAWTVIRQTCPKGKLKLTPGALEAALGSFHGAFGRGLGESAKTDTHEDAIYIFGEADTVATGCTGATGQYCVNYKENLKPGAPGIPWENRVMTAVEALKEMNTAEGLANATFVTLQDLERQARHLYIDALYETSGSKPGGATGTGNESTRVTHTENINPAAQQSGSKSGELQILRPTFTGIMLSIL